jgi:hypothetical protein
MIEPDTYAQSFPAGAFFVLSKANLQAASDQKFDDAVRPVVDAGGGPGYFVTEARTESYSGLRRYTVVTCERDPS